MCRNILAFRTRNHRLQVEVGRWVGLPINERKCDFCNDDIGDEFHFLFKCEQFKIDRKQLIKPYFYKNPNIIKYQELINTRNVSILKKTMSLYCCIVVVLLFYVHGKHLRSCRDGQLT